MVMALRFRSPSRRSRAGSTAVIIPPVNPQSWAAAKCHAGKSNRYMQLTGLHLAPNVAVRPDHGCAWDIHDGTYNVLISDDAVDAQDLQVCNRFWMM